MRILNKNTLHNWFRLLLIGLIFASGLFIATPSQVAEAAHGDDIATRVFCRTGNVVFTNADGGQGAVDHIRCDDNSEPRVATPRGEASDQRVLFADCTRTDSPPIFRRQVAGTFVFLAYDCSDYQNSNARTALSPSFEVVPDWYHSDIRNGEEEEIDPGSLPSCDTNKQPVNESGEVIPGGGQCIDNFTRCQVFDGDGNVIEGETGVYGIPTSTPGEDGNFCTEFDPNDSEIDLADNPILIFAGQMITFISAGVGFILVTITIIAGIRYTLARGNPQETAASKSMIEKVVISVVLYIFAFVIINWLIPGGLL